MQLFVAMVITQIYRFETVELLPHPDAAMQTTPYSVWDNSTVKGAKLLKDAHARLMAYHANASIELPPGTQDRLPTEAIVAFWDSAITWIGGGWSSMKVGHCSSAA